MGSDIPKGNDTRARREFERAAEQLEELGEDGFRSEFPEFFEVFEVFEPDTDVLDLGIVLDEDDGIAATWVQVIDLSADGGVQGQIKYENQPDGGPSTDTLAHKVFSIGMYGSEAPDSDEMYAALYAAFQHCASVEQPDFFTTHPVLQLVVLSTENGFRFTTNI